LAALLLASASPASANLEGSLPGLVDNASAIAENPEGYSQQLAQSASHPVGVLWQQHAAAAWQEAVEVVPSVHVSRDNFVQVVGTCMNIPCPGVSLRVCTGVLLVGAETSILPGGGGAYAELSYPLQGGAGAYGGAYSPYCRDDIFYVDTGK